MVWGEGEALDNHKVSKGGFPLIAQKIWLRVVSAMTGNSP